jgi:hypothetical protein
MMLFSRYMRQAFLSLAFLLLASGSAAAGSLPGTVVKIHDGDTITIICFKRPLQVRLMGIDAPDKEQPYADASRQHLSDLILNQILEGARYPEELASHELLPTSASCILPLLSFLARPMIRMRVVSSIPSP